MRKSRHKAVLALLVLPFLSLQAQEQPALITISGTVIDSVGGQPLAGVLVTSRLLRSEAPASQSLSVQVGNNFGASAPGEDTLGRPIVQGVTDLGGHFSVAASRGRATLVFGKENFGVKTLTYSVLSGATFQAPIVRLVRYGVITGRVFDSKNNPVPSATVTPYILHYQSEGLGFGRYPAVRTDDRGEFRLWGLPADSYVLVFSGATGSAFYPGVAEFSKAEFVSLGSGSERRLKDIVLSTSTKKGSIHVNVINGPEEQPKDVSYTFASTTAGIEPDGLDGNSFFTVGGISSRDPVIHLEANELRPFTHEVTGIGGYRAIATWSDSRGNTIRSTANADFVGEDVTVNLVLKTPDGRLSCRVLLEGEDGVSTPLSGVNILLRPISGSGSNCVSTNDGTYEIPAIHTGEYVLSSFQRAPADSYLSSAKQADRDVLARRIDVTVEKSILEVRFRRGAGIVRGIVTDREERRIQDALVAAIPDTQVPYEVGSQPRFSGRTDQNGEFEIRGLSPGTYRLVAWAVLEDSALKDEFLKKFAEKGTVVAIQEKSVVVQDLRAADQQLVVE